MDDLNDYQYFAQVVAHGGFAAAGRVLGIPKSKLSRRIASLEERLGARLIERSSHSFRVTDVGQSFYERCRSMLLEAERAVAVVCEANSEPQGPIRMSVPIGLINGPVGAMLPDFLERYPKVQLQILATDRRVDVVNERIHLAVRARTKPDTDGELTMRVLGKARRVLIASPELAAQLATSAHVSDLAAFPTVSMSDPVSEWAERESWEFVRRDGERYVLEHKPRLMCRSVPALLHAVRSGTGIGLMLKQECAEDLEAGRLVRVLPEWQTVEGTIYLVFTTARGLPPAVRALVDHLVDRFRKLEWAEVVVDGNAEITPIPA